MADFRPYDVCDSCGLTYADHRNGYNRDDDPENCYNLEGRFRLRKDTVALHNALAQAEKACTEAQNRSDGFQKKLEAVRVLLKHHECWCDPQTKSPCITCQIDEVLNG